MTDLEIFESFFERIKEEIISNHIAAGQKATGKTIESFRVEVEEASGRLTARKDIDNLEKGTPPGTKVDLDAVEEWIKAKGVLRRAASIQRKIFTDGSRLYQDGGRKDIITSAITDERIAVVEKQFADKYFNLVKAEVKQAFK